MNTVIHKGTVLVLGEPKPRRLSRFVHALVLLPAMPLFFALYLGCEFMEWLTGE